VVVQVPLGLHQFVPFAKECSISILYFYFKKMKGAFKNTHPKKELECHGNDIRR
jgi:hypothetical protein